MMFSRVRASDFVIDRTPRKRIVINPETVTMAAALVFLAAMLVWRIAL